MVGEVENKAISAFNLVEVEVEAELGNNAQTSVQETLKYFGIEVQGSSHLDC